MAKLKIYGIIANYMDNEIIILGNWKMSLNLAQSLVLAENIIEGFKPRKNIQTVICPSTVALTEVEKIIKGSGLALGAQNAFWHAKGAYTGETSPEVLAEVGVKYVLLGHSERRQFLKETDSMIKQKILKCLEHGLIPVICVGETFEERKDNQKDFVIMHQVIEALRGIKLWPDQSLIIAYEPVWVIGSGQAVTPVEAEHTAQVIKQALFDVLEPEAAKKTKIIYGGSVSPDNIAGFIEQPTISGALVGGASLTAETFLSLIETIK